MVTARVKATQDVLATIAEGMKSEFSGNGHRVTNSPGTDSSVLVRFGLRKYWCDISIHFWDLEISGILVADVSILQNSTDKPLLVKMLQGNFRESRQIATDTAYETVLNGTLREFIRGFARDPAVLKALEDARAKSGAAAKPGDKNADDGPPAPF